MALSNNKEQDIVINTIYEATELRLGVINSEI